jgi:DNA-binding transcriptional MerR regulator
MTVGELAESGGVTAQTVRYYERRGLLPEPTRSASGYRVYGDDDLWRLALIRRAQALGFTLTEIRELLSARAGDDREGVTARVDAKIGEIDRDIQQLEDRRTRLGHLLTACASGDGACLDLDPGLDAGVDAAVDPRLDGGVAVAEPSRSAKGGSR